MRRRAAHHPMITALLALAILIAGHPTARAQQLVADLSDHLVAITTGFTGAEVMMFGAVEGAGDIVVMITGPSEEVTVRKKSRVGPIWVNTESMTLEGVPNFFAIAASRPLAQFAPDDMRRRLGMGVDALKIKPKKQFGSPLDKDEVARFREAVIRGKQRDGLYSAEVGTVSVISDRLFRTKIWFPSNMATGQYVATVYLVKDGVPMAAQTTPLLVEKIGVGADVFVFAHEHSAFYGLIAIAIAVFAGWLAAAIFRKV